MGLKMQILLLAVLGALIGGAYDAFQTIGLIRTGAYPPMLGIGIILAGTVVGAAVFIVAYAVCRKIVSLRK